MKFAFTFAAVALLGSSAWAADAPTTQPYQLLKSVTVGGDGGWDYVAVDSDARKLYIPRGNRVTVYDADSLQPAGEIPGTAGVHGVAIDPASGHGFTSNGGDGTVTMFDAKTLAVIQKIKVTGRPDGIFFEPATKHIFVESHAAPNITVINGADGAVVGTIDLGGEPEQGASDGNGHVYIDLESTSEVVAVDPAALKVTARWKLGDGEGPAGMGLDAKNHRVFAGCHNQKMVILDTDTGNVLATEPIGNGVDAGAFDPETLEAYSSTGDGKLTVVKENSPTSFAVEEDVTTKPGARTCALDAKTHNIILVTAEYEAPAAAAANTGRQRRRMVPNSFTILVVGKAQ